MGRKVFKVEKLPKNLQKIHKGIVKAIHVDNLIEASRLIDLALNSINKEEDKPKFLDAVYKGNISLLSEAVRHEVDKGRENNPNNTVIQKLLDNHSDTKNISAVFISQSFKPDTEIRLGKVFKVLEKSNITVDDSDLNRAIRSLEGDDDRKEEEGVKTTTKYLKTLFVGTFSKPVEEGQQKIEITGDYSDVESTGEGGFFND